MARYRLSKRADADVAALLTYGYRPSGRERTDGYLRDLTGAFEMLAVHPKAGRRSTVRPAPRRHEHGQHVVFHDEEPDGILVVGIFHRRRVPTSDIL